MKDLKVVKVDGEVYVGALSETTLDDAMQLSYGLTAPLTKDVIGKYLTQQNLVQLITIDFGVQSAVSSRCFNDDEAVIIEQAQYMMRQAEKFALKRLVNKEFASLLGK
jgi:hypothetical protein